MPSKPPKKIIEKNNKKLSLQKNTKHMLTLVFIIAEFFLLTSLYLASYSILIRFVIGILSLFIVGILLARINSLQGNYGLYIYGGKAGIGIIEKLSDHKKQFWIFLSEWGMVLSFGVLSYFLFPKRISKKALVLGLASIIVLILLIYPYFILALQFIYIPNLSSTLSTQASGVSQISIVGYVLLAAVLIGGFFFFIFASLLIGAWQVISGVFSVAASIAASSPNYTPLSTATPALVPAIPGITLPLFAGVLSLAVILIVHEFSHGILSRVYKVKIKKVGLVLFGVLPLGAFVEPDEKHLSKIEKYKQNNMFIAGISANFLFTFIFFILTLIFFTYITPNISTTSLQISSVNVGSPSYNVITPGSIIEQWNGVTVKNISSLESVASADKPFSKVVVTTNSSTYSLTANSSGKIGVFITSITAIKSGLYYSIALFIFQFLTLSLILNFLIAVVNLLPFPGFDGWRIYKNLIKNPKTLTLFSIITVIIFIILFIPWFFIL